MTLPENAVLLRVYTGERHRADGLPLYEAIVRRARETHLAGATVLRGPMGYGRSTRLHRASLLELSEDLPVVVEIIDAKERIEAFLPVVEALVDSGLVTLQEVRVCHPRGGADASGEGAGAP
ncbi:DUF190 domain-containing protein [Geminicoccaceae bacterium 1502E]|nr:DUF190 domain-containing protein [Geminicoccaceae bacterium 1502E]